METNFRQHSNESFVDVICVMEDGRVRQITAKSFPYEKEKNKKKTFSIHSVRELIYNIAGGENFDLCDLTHRKIKISKEQIKEVRPTYFDFQIEGFDE